MSLNLVVIIPKWRDTGSIVVDDVLKVQIKSQKSLGDTINPT